MRDTPPNPIRLADYKRPDWMAEDIDLTFRLHPTATRVIARTRFRRVADHPADLRLDGIGLTLVSLSLNGTTLDTLAPDETGLTLPAQLFTADTATLEIETEINPEANTALEGLYMSKGMYCTQCEAEGFRRITYYQDRPDVMARFRVRIEGDAPVLLSNGNPVAEGPGFAEWEDPHPKPAYLFALVAGDLVHVEDHFTTASGRDVTLRIYTRDGQQGLTGYAMDALKRSMAWDEKVYGRQYDLDLFNIVAVDDFNAGAMENKGLNIFNAKYVLASPETATDRDYALIEGIIAHEYFHNWTGNRITCRDWFQLSLKEGLTVFRDQQFSGDMRSVGVKRIADVRALRGTQFMEDQGPLAHPVRPSEYEEINNFYTATVYDKGAEVIRMLRELVGAPAYDRALALYFERHDGQACTIEDWLTVFEDATGEDLSQFALWYSQAGTPRLNAAEAWEDGRYTLTLTQTLPPTPGQADKAPMVIPVAYGFLGSDGRALGTPGMLVLRKATESWSFDLPERPIASLLRGFSAPVVLSQDLSRRDLAVMLAHDSDPFNRWEAGYRLAMDTLGDMVGGAAPDGDYLAALHRLACDETAEPAFRAAALGLPAPDAVAVHLTERGETPDPVAIDAARRGLRKALAVEMDGDLRRLYAEMSVPGPYRPDAADAGKRALRMAILGLMSEQDRREAKAAFAAADNMTESHAALSILVAHGDGEAALAQFYTRWQDHPNVIDEWFRIQAMQTPQKDILQTITSLSAHPDFTWRTPNRFRALVGGFAFGHFTGFHADDGSGYAWVADWICKLDPLNPQTAARLCGAFESWKLFDAERQAMAEAALSRIAETKDLSRHSSEMVVRILKA